MRNSECVPKFVAECLPFSLTAEIVRLCEKGRISKEDINEIRLRSGKPASVTAAGENILINAVLSSEVLGECTAKLCRGSVYAHGDTIRQGYIEVGDGVRAGVCGIMAADGRAVREVTSLNIRIPHIIRNVCGPILDVCVNGSHIRSVLIYSPPGVGKTTVLRDIAAKLSGEMRRRVAIIDTRGELYMSEMFYDSLCDVLSGYGRALGIETATRTMSPEVIICDELGDAEEARSILGAVSTGVPIILSAHASCIGELLARPNIRLLHENRVFDSYVGLSRENINGRLSRCFTFEITSRSDADKREECFV